MPAKGTTATNAARRYMKRGYVFVKVGSHPNADSKGYIQEHRLVMSEMLGRALNPDEHVHHINEQRDDNRPENLQLMSRGEHRALHWVKARASWSPNHRACLSCGTTARPHGARGLCERCYSREWAKERRNCHR